MMRKRYGSCLHAIAAFLLAGFAAGCFAADLPLPEPAFAGVIGTSAKQSKQDWPEAVKPPAGAPNVVLILLDDAGFAASGAFGGPVQTPTLDRLAGQGLRYNRFHSTALCSPTRAALLTGRDAHRAGFGEVMEASSGFPGYNGIWRRDTASVAEVLRQHGYSTSAFGKWHNTPYWEISPVGPFDRWPTGLGFEYFYGFLMGAASQWEPPLYRNTQAVEQPKSVKDGYHFTTDIANEAITWVRTHQSLVPEKPYFLYFATGATHAPHHVPKAWIDHYRGRFDQGWDRLREEIFERQKKLGVIPADAELTPRPREMPAWDSLSQDQHKLLSRQMEVFAAMLAHTDHEVGRLIDAVQNGPGGENTLIIYIAGDNGASAEGGPEGGDVGNDLQHRLRALERLGDETINNQYSAAWAWATGTPFQWTKQVASHFGGTRVPVVVSWPAHIKDHGAIRQQFTHVNAVAATLYEVIGIEAPVSVNGVKQLPLDGPSFAASFDRSDAPSLHREQLFEQMGNRAMYKDGWIASARHSIPWSAVRSEDFSKDRWELYHVDSDFSQAHDLATQYPDKLRELQELFDRRAWEGNVYPLNNGFGGKAFGADLPKVLAPSNHYVFYPGLPRMTVLSSPDFSRSHRIEAALDIPSSGGEGVLLATGGRFGGFAFYLQHGKVVYEQNFQGAAHQHVVSDRMLPSGRVEVAVEFTWDEPPHMATGGASKMGERGNAPLAGSGTVRLFINGRPAGEAHLAQAAAPSFTDYVGSFTVGRGPSSPLSDRFDGPFPVAEGLLQKVEVWLR